jgi:hypothetical protein
MAFWYRAHSDKCFFQLLNPGFTRVTLLESESGFEIVTQLVDTGKQSSSVHNFISYLVYMVFTHCEL